MVLLADSGSSKTDWRWWQPGEEPQKLESAGLNPYVLSQSSIIDRLNQAFPNSSFTTSVYELFFYGAGCSHDKRKKRVYDALKQVFPNATIHVQHDLLGAARALCGDQPGVACILGTGSSSCLYNGSDVADSIPSLGYLLGDEGGGVHIGQALMRAYFYRQMPPDLSVKFEQETNPDAHFQAIYDSDKPNYLIAQLTRFAHDQLDHPFIQKLVEQCFEAFISAHVLAYKHPQLPVHFLGSIAHYFADVLHTLCGQHNLKVGLILRKPIDNLILYHTHED